MCGIQDYVTHVISQKKKEDEKVEIREIICNPILTKL